MKKILLPALLGLTIAIPACADDAPVSATLLGMDLIDSTPLKEVWIDSGFASYHWDRDKGLNGNNYGLGAEYRFSTVSALTAGRFYNSNREYSD